MYIAAKIVVMWVGNKNNHRILAYLLQIVWNVGTVWIKIPIE